MRTETVVFDQSAPVVVTHLGTLVTRTYAVHPVVFIGKTAARPPEIGNIETFERFKHVGTIPFGIGNRRLLADP